MHVLTLETVFKCETMVML